jgi:hypothetical protein
MWRSDVGSARVTDSLVVPPLCPQLRVCQTMSPQLAPNIAFQLAGIGAWLSESLGPL